MAGYASTRLAHHGGFFHWIASGIVLLFLTLLFSVLAQLFQSAPASCTGPQCTGPPPQTGPLSAPAVYTSSRYGFSVDYSNSGGSAPSQTTDSSISWDGTLSDGSEVSWTILGGPPNGQTAQQITSSMQSQNFPDAQQAYIIPGAAVGYTSGYGAVYDLSAAPAGGQVIHERVIIMVAVRGNLAIAVSGVGPYQQSTPGSGPPDPADTPLVNLGDFEENVESVTWPGQSPL